MAKEYTYAVRLTMKGGEDAPTSKRIENAVFGVGKQPDSVQNAYCCGPYVAGKWRANAKLLALGEEMGEGRVVLHGWYDSDKKAANGLKAAIARFEGTGVGHGKFFICKYDFVQNAWMRA